MADRSFTADNTVDTDPGIEATGTANAATPANVVLFVKIGRDSIKYDLDSNKIASSNHTDVLVVPVGTRRY